MEISNTTLLTQGAAAERKKNSERRQGTLKDTMKRMAAVETEKEQVGGGLTGEADSRKAGSIGLKQSTKSTKRKANKPVIQPVKVVKPKKSPVAQGLRKVPIATDEHGCAHSGVRDLVVLQKNYLVKYVKVGGWLHERPCKGCAEDKTVMGDRDRVMAMSSLLGTKGTNNGVGFICNCGPVGHGMEEGNPAKGDYTCDMALCMACYTSRMEVADSSSDGNRRTRRKRKM